MDREVHEERRSLVETRGRGHGAVPEEQHAARNDAEKRRNHIGRLPMPLPCRLAPRERPEETYREERGEEEQEHMRAERETRRGCFGHNPLIIAEKRP